MTSIKDIYWLAGFLEGEGTFYATEESRTSLTIYIGLSNSDYDVLFKAYSIMKPSGSICEHKSKFRDGYIRRKHYRFSICGVKAISWMMTIYPLMGIRRRARIKDIIEQWKVSHMKNGHQTKIYKPELNYIGLNSALRTAKMIKGAK